MALLADCVVASSFETVDPTLTAPSVSFNSTYLTKGGNKMPALTATWAPITNPYIVGIEFEYGPTDLSQGITKSDANKGAQSWVKTDGVIAGESYAARLRAKGDGYFGPWSSPVIVVAGAEWLAGGISGDINWDQVAGPGRPSDNAGTTLTIRANSPANLSVQGNTITRTGGAGTWTGVGTFFSAERFLRGCSVSGRMVSGGECMFGMSSDEIPAAAASPSSFHSIDYAFYRSGPNFYAYESGVQRLAMLGTASDAVVCQIVYDGLNVRYYLDGVLKRTILAGQGRSFFAHGDIGIATAAVVNVRVDGAASVAAVDGLWNTIGTGQYGQGAIVTSEGVAALVVDQGPGATAPANRVLNDRYAGGVRTIAQPDGAQFNGGSIDMPGRLQIVLPFGGTNSMLTFELAIYDYAVGQTVRYIIGGYTYGNGPNWLNVTAQYIGPRGFARPVRFGHYLGKAYIWIGNVGDLWQYSVAVVRNVQIGYSNQTLAWETGWSISLNTTADISALVNDTISTPRAGDQVFGEGLLEAPGGAVATRPNFRTDLGVSAMVHDQGPWTTYTGLAPTNVAGQVQYLNTSGRIVDGRGMPLNAASGNGITISPDFIFSAPATNADTSISVAASTVTLVGGATLSLPSGTITGLSAGIGYWIFRDLQTSTYVAVSGNATTQLTSADRYLYLGIQYTQQPGGGGYVPLPPPPPGSGGGLYDRPGYVDI